MITQIDTTFAFWPWFILFLVIVYGIFACLGDIITTAIGLTAGKGFKEGNPIAAWMFKKMGQSFAGWLGGVGYLAACLFIGAANWEAGVVCAGLIGAAETYFAIHNYLLMKRLGIKL